MSEVNRTAARAHPYVPKAETLSAFEVADLADRFIGHVEGFLTRDPSIAPIAILGPDPDPQDDLRRTDEHRRESERQFIKRIGPVLAEALQRCELNASPLLKFLHRVDTATQRENISTIWEDVKVSLQENVLRLRKNRTTVASTPPSSDDAGNNIVESSGGTGRYRFILSDRRWTLQFKSEQSECEDTYDGFHYIHALLENASEKSSATELLVSRNKPRIMETQQAVFKKGEVNGLLKQIDGDITAAEDADNLERAEELKEQKRSFETELCQRNRL